MSAYAGWRDVPVPRYMRYLRRDPRGYPIPYIAMRDAEGRAHFTINDHHAVAIVTRKRACAICGRPLRGPGWFVGGPKAFLHERGAFLDPPSHHECAQYAMRVCPYIAAPSYARRIDSKTLSEEAMPADTVIVREPGQDERPPFFMLGEAARWQTTRGLSPGVRMIVPEKPWLTLEVWRGGERIEAAEAAAMIQQATIECQEIV